MNYKILTIGLSITAVCNLLVFIVVLNTQIVSYIPMFSSLFIALLAWYLLIKKDVPIGIKTKDTQVIKSTLPLLFIPMIATAYFLNIAIPNTNLLLLMLITSFAIGIFEEIIFRGIAFGSLLSSGISPKKSIFISAIIFSIFHIVTTIDYPIVNLLLHIMNTFIMGVVLAYIYYASNNIFYVISIHTVWDFGTFISRQYPLDNIGSAITILVFAMSVLYFSWSYKKLARM